MVTIRSRRSWGARRPDGDVTLTGLAREVFLHHTVTTHLSPNATVAQEQAEMRKIEDIGYRRFGRYGIGISYNAIVFPSGRAYQGVSWNRRGAHTGGRNSTARAICFAGNYETREPTAAALATAAAIVAKGRGKWWVRSAPVRGHRDVASTACPGRYVYAQRARIAAGGALLGGGGTSRPTAPSKPAPTPATGIATDGKWGPDTTRALQRRLKEAGLYSGAVDGQIDSQNRRWRDRNLGLRSGWQWKRRGYTGSRTIRALQGVVGAKQDGLVGPETFKALQRWLRDNAIYSGAIDGELWNPSSTIRSLQRVTNSKRGFKR
ncbi:hypothetical protein GCM10009718_37010 [Isoptericola halotolerans]|uniref:N-acetylmuramoyl-L-alanine amidase n=1 Tax=Isoptericola halotolerans TaxID=300560 RepID=A0ABX2A6L1_9MICO|nr:N-acetylmuramoyl-L-alanine amidase [Isoptericola halotolerans]NOV98231.1 hypothetical protein [Isoptericola halotolerans]